MSAKSDRRIVARRLRLQLGAGWAESHRCARYLVGGRFVNLTPRDPVRFGSLAITVEWPFAVDPDGYRVEWTETTVEGPKGSSTIGALLP